MHGSLDRDAVQKGMPQRTGSSRLQLGQQPSRKHGLPQMARALAVTPAADAAVNPLPQTPSSVLMHGPTASLEAEREAGSGV
jgi:hypothetical protein